MEKLYISLIVGLLAFAQYTQEIHAGREYVSKDPRECRIILFVCEEGKNPFYDRFGCGCIEGPDLPPPERPEFCTEEYRPVCALKQVQCIKAPCNPMPQTYSNRCHALRDGAFNIQEGECQP